MSAYRNNCVISNLFTNISKKNHRGILLINGSKSKFKIPLIHYLWTKSSSQTRSNILWCYSRKNEDKYKKEKKNLLSIHKKNIDTQENFFKLKKIRHCFYEETKKILGNTYGMCILQDFESITPNSLARIVETIEGGGIIIFTMDSSISIKNIHDISLKIYQKFKNQVSTTVTGRFLDRFFLSLKCCETFLFLNDNMEILHFSGNEVFKEKYFKKIEEKEPSNQLLVELIKNIGTIEPISSLLSKAKTFDQARAFLTFIEALADKKKWSTAFLTSNRGRGKSATLGLSVAASIAYGYGNIFITAPDPENLHSFFAFLFIGLEAIGYIENKDFEIIYNPQHSCIDNVHIFCSHRQIIKFVFPYELSLYKNQIELLIIDEAAGISSFFLDSIIGPHITFISSTTSGYEGFGKALMLKMAKKIKFDILNHNFEFGNAKPRIFREIVLDKPIRYARNDPVEKWIYDLLCLNIDQEFILLNGCPNPNFCKLFLVDRNSLFRGHILANKFLQKIIGLFSSSHYKNSPDDLQMICDAPSHRILVLITPFNLSIGFLPDLLCVLHICYEGQINQKFAHDCLSKGIKVKGDLIPWVLSNQYLDPGFAQLSCLRIVRIATHPDSQSMGYGTEAIRNLYSFSNNKENFLKKFYVNNNKKNIIEEDRTLEYSPPMLIELNFRCPPILDYIAVSFGLTFPLLCFWKKNGFSVVLIRPFLNKTSQEHTSIMIKKVLNIKKNFPAWDKIYQFEFYKQFISGLNLNFSQIPVILINNIMENFCRPQKMVFKKKKKIGKFFSPFDFQQILFIIEKKFQNFDSITYLFPVISKLYFFGYFSKNLFSPSEIIIIISIGLQGKSVESVKKELFLKNEYFSKIFKAIIMKVYKELDKIRQT
ncbi:N-acetyltransferase 10 (nucleomorph) [Chroomonas mesostigmatica CCMP1168]|uniref:N-acetyltransferase 10 n=1 Tax=Chroomonas mesostigmatica CCMP1168 TaxID=1195612 RepID=J7G164_9CRYP|nr:N-acetyltransferase 10 [Chroomonas mesostigmatica CCMP1168]